MRAARRIARAATTPFFGTIVIEGGDDLIERGAEAGYNFRRVDDTGVGIALDETVTRDDLEALARLLGAELEGAVAAIPAALVRGTAFLKQAIFSRHHAEHEMLRYLKRLEDKDIALNRSMIPLGSCTMKLNATAEMIADHLARLCRYPSVRSGGPDGGVSDADPPPGSLAVRRDRVRRGVVAAQCRVAGRVCRAAGDPRLARIARRSASRRLPDPVLGARHESRQRGDGGLKVVVVGCDRDGNVDLGICAPRRRSTRTGWRR